MAMVVRVSPTAPIVTQRAVSSQQELSTAPTTHVQLRA
ncbi:hypothetical protein GGR64_003505 [Xanthomonas arboricola]|nr:hypothetical protein [Xanthomonas sp. 3498]MBB5943902.1 hypothetical protein [Xanthomonas sp. 3307]